MIAALAAGMLVAALPALGAAEPAAAGRTAHPFAYRDINPGSATHGQELALNDLLDGRGVVLNFIASWCGPCWGELPEFQRLYSDGTPIIAVAADEYDQPADALVGRLEAAGVTMPVLLVPKADIDTMERFYDHRFLPSTYLVDAQGAIRRVFEGVVSGERLLAAVHDDLPRARGASSGGSGVSAPSP